MRDDVDGLERAKGGGQRTDVARLLARSDCAVGTFAQNGDVEHLDAAGDAFGHCLSLAAHDEVAAFATATCLVQIDVDGDRELFGVGRRVAEAGVEVLTGRLGTGRLHGHRCQLFRAGVGDHDGRTEEVRLCRVRIGVGVLHDEFGAEGRGQLREVRVGLCRQVDRCLDVGQQFRVGVGLGAVIQRLQLAAEGEGDQAEGVVEQRGLAQRLGVEVHQLDQEPCTAFLGRVVDQVVVVEVDGQIGRIAVGVEGPGVIHRHGDRGGVARNTVGGQRGQVLDGEIAIGEVGADFLDIADVLGVEGRAASEVVAVTCLEVDFLDAAHLGLDVGVAGQVGAGELVGQLGMQTVIPCAAVDVGGGRQGVGHAAQHVLAQAGIDVVIACGTFDTGVADLQIEALAFDRRIDDRIEEVVGLCLGGNDGSCGLVDTVDDGLRACGGGGVIGEVGNHLCGFGPVQSGFDLVEDDRAVECARLLVVHGTFDDGGDDLTNRDRTGHAVDRILKRIAPEDQAGGIGVAVEEVLIERRDERGRGGCGGIREERVHRLRLVLTGEVGRDHFQIEAGVGDHALPELNARGVRGTVVVTDIDCSERLTRAQCTQVDSHGCSSSDNLTLAPV